MRDTIRMSTYLCCAIQHSCECRVLKTDIKSDKSNTEKSQNVHTIEANDDNHSRDSTGFDIGISLNDTGYLVVKEWGWT